MSATQNIFGKILVAVDASPRASAVFDAAAALAARFGAELCVLQVITIPPEFPPAAATTQPDSLPAHMQHVATENILALWGRAPHVPKTAPIVEIGQPWRCILETAKRLDVDLIVLGSHGYQGWDRVWATTAAQVANRADRNVFVVHPRKTEGAP